MLQHIFQVISILLQTFIKKTYIRKTQSQLRPAVNLYSINTTTA